MWIIKKLTAATLFLAMTLTSCEKETTLENSEIPSEITSYISTHFPDNPILKVTKDLDGSKKSYEVLLDGKFSLEFNEKKEVTDIDGTTKLPDSVIPSKILSYVATNYPTNFITDWGLDGNNQEIELDNRIELVFNASSDFLRIDK